MKPAILFCDEASKRLFEATPELHLAGDDALATGMLMARTAPDAAREILKLANEADLRLVVAADWASAICTAVECAWRLGLPVLGVMENDTAPPIPDELRTKVRPWCPAGNAAWREVAAILDEPIPLNAGGFRLPGQVADELVATIPTHAHAIRVVGEDGEVLAARIQQARPQAAVETVQDLANAADFRADCIVLARPVPHNDTAETMMRTARAYLEGRGLILAAFRNALQASAAEALAAGHWTPPLPGACSASALDGYSPKGVELLFSRCDLTVAAVREAPATYAPDDFATLDESARLQNTDYWVVAVVPREAGMSEFGDRRFWQRQIAEVANRRGELAFQEGDLHGALTAFAEAIREWKNEALYFNNLGAVLQAMGQHEGAWERFVEALHLDPALPSARDNLAAAAPLIGKEAEAKDILGLFGRRAPIPPP